MKLYILRPIKGYKWGYDCAWGFVVRAEDEQQARELAASQRGDEWESTWLDSDMSTCIELTADGEACVVMRDFNAG